MKRIRNFILFLIASICIISCNDKYPITISECEQEVKLIISSLKNENFNETIKYIGKYENFKKYNTQDIIKEYAKLISFLKTNGAELNYNIENDTLSLNLENQKQIISYVNFKVTSENKLVCRFSYGLNSSTNRYELISFLHRYIEKKKAGVPK